MTAIKDGPKDMTQELKEEMLGQLEKMKHQVMECKRAFKKFFKIQFFKI